MLCCNVCRNVSKRDYKVASTDGGVEMEPLGGPDLEKDKDGADKSNGNTGKLCFL